MAKLSYYGMIGAIGIVIVCMTGCAVEPPIFIQRALGKEIAEQRKLQGQGTEWCPKITTFTVSPLTVKCGGQVSLELAATARSTEPLTYMWDIEGYTKETGQKAVWNTPTSKTIGDPEKVFTVRGIVTDGQCAITRSAEVTVLCMSTLDRMVHFEFGKSHLDATAKTELDEIGEKLLQHPTQSVLIEGHTDHIGGEQFNKRLGERRAEAVKNYLVQTWGITPDRIITRSYGEEQPIAPNVTITGRAKNRRAEVFRVVLSTK
jgi:outer membrane protein OmpA-like peptidoglycan-associated protein